MDMTNDEKLVYNTLLSPANEEDVHNVRKDTQDRKVKDILFQHWDSAESNPYHSAIVLSKCHSSYKQGKKGTFCDRSKLSQIYSGTSSFIVISTKDQTFICILH